MKDRAILLERLMNAQSDLRRMYLEVASPSLQMEFAPSQIPPPKCAVLFEIVVFVRLMVAYSR